MEGPLGAGRGLENVKRSALGLIRYDNDYARILWESSSFKFREFLVGRADSLYRLVTIYS